MTASEKLAQESDDSRGKTDRLRKWRREKVWEYKAMGCSVEEIVDILKAKPEIRISHGTVINDLKTKQTEIDRNFKNYVKDMPMQNCLIITGLDRVLKEAWRIHAKDENKAEKMLPIIVTAYKEKLAAIGDRPQIDRALKIVAKLEEQLQEREQEKQEVENSQ